MNQLEIQAQETLTRTYQDARRLFLNVAKCDEIVYHMGQNREDYPKFNNKRYLTSTSLLYSKTPSGYSVYMLPKEFHPIDLDPTNTQEKQGILGVTDDFKSHVFDSLKTSHVHKFELNLDTQSRHSSRRFRFRRKKAIVANFEETRNNEYSFTRNDTDLSVGFDDASQLYYLLGSDDIENFMKIILQPVTVGQRVSSFFTRTFGNWNEKLRQIDKDEVIPEMNSLGTLVVSSLTRFGADKLSASTEFDNFVVPVTISNRFSQAQCQIGMLPYQKPQQGYHILGELSNKNRGGGLSVLDPNQETLEGAISNAD